MKVNSSFNVSLQMSAIYVSLASTMCLPKKEKCLQRWLVSPKTRTASNPVIFLELKTDLKNLFVHSARNYIALVSDAKNSAINHCEFAGEHVKNSKNSTFPDSHHLRDWIRVK